jgi:hypothetical protein
MAVAHPTSRLARPNVPGSFWLSKPAERIDLVGCPEGLPRNVDLYGGEIGGFEKAVNTP